MEMGDTELLLLLAPVLVLDLAIRCVAGYQLYKADVAEVRGGNKAIWAVVIALINFGWVGWFLAGKNSA